MKRVMKWIIPLLLVGLLISSAVWYMLVYDRSTVQDFLNAQARNSAKNGHFSTATWFYNLSYQLSDKNQDVAIELADIYRSAGNYTKAEYTLTNAIAKGASADLYVALSQTFVEQDKLLDAVTMLDSIPDAAIKAELDAMRPAAPTVDLAPGFYSEYVTANISGSGGALYVTTDGRYPSTAAQPSSGVVALEGGETKVYAISVAENGLVSPISIFNYTIGGVIEDVTLADPAMDALVRSQLSLSADAVISTKDLWTITELTVPAEVTTLEDLRYFVTLEKLTIEGRSIADLGMLAGMGQMKELTIRNCILSAPLSVLENMKSLEKLTISGSGLSSLDDLAGLTSLVALDLSDNAIGDLSRLSGLTGLEELYLSGNAVKDLTPLSGMTVLSVLDVSRNALTSIAPVASCTRLNKLYLNGNAVSDISPAGQLLSLTDLSAANNALTNLNGLSGCTSLSKLDVSNNQITTLEGISGISSLTELSFANNQVTSIPDLGSESLLVRIVGDYNKLTDISALGGMPNLNDVFLDYNAELTDVSTLTSCPLISQVNVYGTGVAVDSLTGLIDMGVVVNYDPT